MLLPGPEAQQLAIYIGWLMHRTRGGLIAGLLFILPGALVMLGLSALHVTRRHVPLIEGLFFGVKAAVLAIVIEAGLRIGRRALRTPAMRFLALAAFLALFLFKAPFPLVILAAGLVGWAGTACRPLDLVWLSRDVPMLSSLDGWAALLALAAMFATLRFRLGIMPVLAACAAAGVAFKGLGSER